MNTVGVLSFKGSFSSTFTKPKQDFTSEKAIIFLAGLQKSYPEKIEYTYSKTRGATADIQHINNMDDSCLAINCCIEGCVKAFNIQISAGSVMDPVWGQCTKYEVSFGVNSMDTGHINYLTALPDIKDGCYKLRANFTGKLGKKKSKDKYTVCADLEICVMRKSMKDYMILLEKGYIVYPLKLHYPNLFSSDSTSESEAPTTDDEQEDDEVEEGPMQKKKKMIVKDTMKSRLKIMKKKGSSRASTLFQMMKTGTVYPKLTTGGPSFNTSDPLVNLDVEDDNEEIKD